MFTSFFILLITFRENNKRKFNAYEDIAGVVTKISEEQGNLLVKSLRELGFTQMKSVAYCKRIARLLCVVWVMIMKNDNMGSNVLYIDNI